MKPVVRESEVVTLSVIDKERGFDSILQLVRQSVLRQILRHCPSQEVVSMPLGGISRITEGRPMRLVAFPLNLTKQTLSSSLETQNQPDLMKSSINATASIPYLISGVSSGLWLRIMVKVRYLTYSVRQAAEPQGLAWIQYPVSWLAKKS